MKTTYLLIVIAIVICSCRSQKATTAIPDPPANAMAPVIIYKTKTDYSRNVPVTLSADKQTVTSYPAPSDVYRNGQLAYPTALANGYYLDNRGIGPNSAFTKYTYDDYSKLSQAPSLNDLYNSITDKDPFVEIYRVDKATGRDVNKINAVIKGGDLSGWKRLK